MEIGGGKQRAHLEEELIMGATTIRQQITSMIDELPSDVLPELVEFIDFLRFKAVRLGLAPQVQEAIRLYIAGEVSLGRAAEMADMNYFLFEELLRKQAIPVVAARATDEAERIAQGELADEVLA
jgi:acetylglutamate kinase